MKPAKVPGIPPQLPLDAARDLMIRHRIGYLPVMEARHCVGLLTAGPGSRGGRTRGPGGGLARRTGARPGRTRRRKAAKPELRAFQDLLGEFQDAEAATAARSSAELPAAWHELRGDLRPLWT